MKTKNLIRKELFLKVASVDETNFIIRGIFSTGGEDRHGEVIDQAGWQLDEFLKNPVVLFAHDQWTPAVGQVIELVKTGNELSGAIKFAVEEFDLARTLFGLYKGGYMRAFSVGFENLTYENDQQNDRIILRENVLYELSCVNVPANAMALANSKGFDLMPIREVQKHLREKKVVPFVANDTMPEDTEWDSAAVQSALWGDGVNQAKYAKAHTWYDMEAPDDDEDGYPDTKGAYKLPHHNAELKVVWKGVAAAMAALLGARGGVNIPESDRQGVYNHLAKHYKQFEKEVPEFKTLEKINEEYETEVIAGVVKGIDEKINEIKRADMAKENKKVETPLAPGGKSLDVRQINNAIRKLIALKKNKK